MLCKLHSSRFGITRFGSMGIISAELLHFATLRTAFERRVQHPLCRHKGNNELANFANILQKIIKNGVEVQLFHPVYSID